MEGPLRDDLRVIETFRPALWHRHRVRLLRTCETLEIPLDPDMADRAVAGLKGRARLTVGLKGDVEASDAPLTPTQAPWRLMWAEALVKAGDPWRAVKTTHRAIYDDARDALPGGIDEAIFLNDEDRVAEGAITTVFVERDGRLLTPPVKAGALPGILRETLLDEGRAEEAQLTREDIETAEALYVGNALRGLIPAIRPM